MSTILSLPPEITELIVDSVAFEDKRFSSTKALSLVCHATLPHCQKQLFATISLFEDPKRALQTANTLLELLTVTPELGPHIRSIVIFDSDVPSRDLSMLSGVSQKLTKLQFLHLVKSCYYEHKNFRWSQAQRHALLSLIHLPTLTHLSLDRICGFSLYDLIPCINLKDLNIIAVDFEDGPPAHSMGLTNPITLERLSIKRLGSESLRSLWRTQRADGKPIIELVTLKVLFVHPRPNQQLGEIAEYLGNGLQLVEFELYTSFNGDYQFKLGGVYSIFMGSLKTLKHLKFNLVISGEVAPDDPIPALAHELGKAYGHNAISNIKIVVQTVDMLTPTRVQEWGTLDHMLSGGGWPALKHVSLVIMVLDKGELEAALFQLPETHFGGLMTNAAIQFEFDIIEY